MSFNFNRGYNSNRAPFNPFATQETRGWVNPALQGAISFPEKVMGLTCLAFAAAVGGVVIGFQGLDMSVGGGYLLWFIAEIALVVATQALADRPVIGITLFVAFGVVTGLIISPLLYWLAQTGAQGIVYEALAATAATTGGVTIYARTTSRDFSRMGNWLFGALIGIVVAMVIGLFLHSTAFQIFISAAACVLFSLFLLYDVQRVTMTRMGTQGNAIRMALRVYLDIFNLFINLLSILALTQGGGSNRR
ncbi:MAG TPA: Bax inhibitor-1/YccA family protein [Candidatus Binatia bacterium]|nr:Bax inhibitor-1/YccA family protein [Candidatus Binatia bacterium]